MKLLESLPKILNGEDTVQNGENTGKGLKSYNLNTESGPIIPVSRVTLEISLIVSLAFNLLGIIIGNFKFEDHFLKII